MVEPAKASGWWTHRCRCSESEASWPNGPHRVSTALAEAYGCELGVFQDANKQDDVMGMLGLGGSLLILTAPSGFKAFSIVVSCS